MDQQRRHPALWLTGPAAAILFAVSVVGFAAVRTDGYTHGTKAVSELGAIGAPSAAAFNLLGFILPGALIVVFALALAAVSGRKSGPYLLVLSGMFMALAGLAPAKLDTPRSLTMILHIVGAMGAGVFWVAALFWLGPLLRSQFHLKAWGRLTPWFGLFLLTNVGWQAAYQSTGAVLPGWGQRIGFLGIFLWLAITGILLWRNARQ